LTPTPELFRDVTERLRAAGVDYPRLVARVLWEHAHTKTLSPTSVGERESLFESFIRRRIAREPVAYITGHREFWSLDFAVGPGVLVPRPESETLIEQLVRAFPDKSAPLALLDLGAGSGCLIAAALSEYPNATGTAVERSEAALAYCRANLEKLGLSGRCRVIAQDFAQAAGSYDGILANPPYIRRGDIASLAPEVRLFEPLEALDGGEDGLEAYRLLVTLSARLLKPSGLAFFEIGASQADALSAMMGRRLVGIVPDLAGNPRCAVGRKS